MTRSCFLSVMLLTISLTSCKKDSGVKPDAQTILLKDITIRNLPSPYYHFSYNVAGDLTKASFSSGTQDYTIQYASDRFNEINNVAVNQVKLQYEYQGGKVFLVKYINEGGEIYKRCFIDYNSANLPIHMEWETKQNIGFALQQTMNFTYHPDNNLRELLYHRLPTDNQPEVIQSDRYENYDSKVNVDGFSLLHPHNDHLLLLPGITLQKNNPGKNTRVNGTTVHYVITYNYTYNESGRPVEKRGDLVFVSGPDQGNGFETLTTYSYYPR